MKPVEDSEPLAVAFAPDWSQGNPYQSHLKQALQGEQVSVSYIQPRNWGFPLAEVAEQRKVRLIHLHWPEAFFDPSGRIWRVEMKKLRYWIDFHRASACCPLVLTAHNLYPHNRRDEEVVRALVRMTYTKARAVIAHSAAAAITIQREFGVKRDKLQVIPHGTGGEDDSLVTQLSSAEARDRLGIQSDQPICLIFGVIAPYKGIEEVVRFWKAHSPDCDLRIVGSPTSLEYCRTLEKLIDHHPRIYLLARWLSDEEIKVCLRAANCVLFNYSHILTSGAAIQARSLGIPILLPHRLRTVDLSEPHPLVTRFWRFDFDFNDALRTALATKPDYALAEEFRKQTSWPQVARMTAELYRSILEN